MCQIEKENLYKAYDTYRTNGRQHDSSVYVIIKAENDRSMTMNWFCVM